MRPLRLLLLAALASGCGPTIAQRRGAARPSLALLQAGRFNEAAREAKAVLDKDAGNPQAHVVAAITGYKAGMQQLAADVRTGFGLMTGGFNDRYLRFSLQKAGEELAAAEAHLAAAAREPWVDVELCIACWEVDWNGSGRIDDRDRHLFEMEVDEAGREIDSDDPRRRPTFRFDVGDVYWARAMVAFQRAVLEIVQAYRWDAFASQVIGLLRGGDGVTLRIPLGDKARVHVARELVLAGLAHADRARIEYLAETDDDREWVPNPRQKSHPLPLPVDGALYTTWAEVTGDLQRLLRSEEGIDVAAVAQLGDRHWRDPPRGFIDVGRMFAEPGDIEIPLDAVKRVDRDNAENLLHGLFGRTYVDRMKPTPLLDRVGRMKGEVEKGKESLERKLRYLLWLN